MHTSLAIVILGGTLYEHEIFSVPLPPKLPSFNLIGRRPQL
jgi:hypothetical protein